MPSPGAQGRREHPHQPMTGREIGCPNGSKWKNRPGTCSGQAGHEKSAPDRFRFLSEVQCIFVANRTPAGRVPFCMISTKLTGFLSAPQQIRSSTFCSRSILDSLGPDWLGRAGTWLPCLKCRSGTRTLVWFESDEPSWCSPGRGMACPQRQTNNMYYTCTPTSIGTLRTQKLQQSAVPGGFWMPRPRDLRN